MTDDRPFGLTEFCDDIRLEVDGKFTLVGVYNGIMVSRAGFPLYLPKIGFAVTFMEPEALAEKREFDAHLTVTTENGNNASPLLQQTLPPANRSQAFGKGLPRPAGEQIYAIAKINLVAVGLTLARTDIFRVRIAYGDEIVKCGSLRVIAADDANRDA